MYRRRFEVARNERSRYPRGHWNSENERKALERTGAGESESGSSSLQGMAARDYARWPSQVLHKGGILPGSDGNFRRFEGGIQRRMGDGNSKTAVVMTGTSRCVVGPYGKLKIAPLPIQASRRSNGPWQLSHAMPGSAVAVGRPRAQRLGSCVFAVPGPPAQFRGGAD